MRRFSAPRRPRAAVLAAVLAGLGLLLLVTLLTGLPARALPPVIDLNTPSAGLTVYGDDPAGQSGWAPAARGPAGWAGSSEQGMS